MPLALLIQALRENVWPSPIATTVRAKTPKEPASLSAVLACTTTLPVSLPVLLDSGTTGSEVVSKLQPTSAQLINSSKAQAVFLHALSDTSQICRPESVKIVLPTVSFVNQLPPVLYAHQDILPTLLAYVKRRLRALEVYYMEQLA